MKISFQLQDILQRNLENIWKRSLFRNENRDKDLNCQFSPPPNMNQSNSMSVNLILFSDGVSIKKSTQRKQLWPVWVQIADLPPKQRISRQNILLLALFLGPKNPDWNELVPYIKNELTCAVKICHNGKLISVLFKIRLLVADLCAKGHMLNMFKFNGHYGCHYCTAPGKTIGKTHSYYPFQETGRIREASVNDVFINYAECLPVNRIVNVVGVKGRSAFAGIIDNLHLTAPTDYMHCVLLGVFPEVLKLCYRSLSTEDKDNINVTLSSLSCPREMIAYSRKKRSLAEMSQFKANEYFNWLFYISPIVFLNRINSNLYSHLLNLVFGTRLLLESSADENVTAADIFLNNFCEEIVSIHDGNRKAETINVHSLRHFVDQVKRYGPLFCFSAMSFEAANRTLSELFTGAYSECEIIYRRVLLRNNLAAAEITDVKLRNLFCQLSTNIIAKESKFSEEFVETKALAFGRSVYLGAEFFNRQNVANVYFDSRSYSRSKHGNCFVSFMAEGEENFGVIEYFIKICGPPYFGKTQAIVTLYKIFDNVGPVNGFFYRVEPTRIESLVAVESLQKIFCLDDFSGGDQKTRSCKYIIKLCSTFEHS